MTRFKAMTNTATIVTRSEYDALLLEVSRHDELYYVADAPELSDAEYDMLKRRLLEIESANPSWVTSSSPSKRVGYAPLDAFAKVTRVRPMLSLENARDTSELRAFLDKATVAAGGVRPDFVLEPKFDGVAVELIYKFNGNSLSLVSGATRGDGLVGEDVTENVKTIANLPQRVNSSELKELTLRGEVYVRRFDLEQYNAERVARSDVPLKSARGAASGGLKQLDSREAARRPLRVVVYDMLDSPFLDHVSTMVYLKAIGFPVPDDSKLITYEDDLEAALLEAHLNRSSLLFDTDGIVVKINSFAARDVLGATRTAPRWAVAWKPVAPSGESRLLSVEVNVGRTGVVTPVAVLAPVQVGGVTVTRATLHNWDQVSRLGAMVGDVVVVERAGEVIPQVTSVLLERRVGREAELLAVVKPTSCPSCAAKLSRRLGEVALRCTNTSCSGQLEEALSHFCSKDAMDVDGFGPSICQALVRSGLVSDLSDLYILNVEQLSALPQMGKKSAAKATAALAASRSKATLSKLLIGLGMPLIGRTWAKKVASKFKSLSELAAASSERVATTLASVPGFGEERTLAICDWLADPRHRATLSKFMTRGVSPTEPETTAESDALAGEVVCVTGTLSIPRRDIQRRIELAGGSFVSSVTKKTTYLLAGASPGADKTNAAAKLGIPVVDETWFESRLASKVS